MMSAEAMMSHILCYVADDAKPSHISEGTDGSPKPSAPDTSSTLSSKISQQSPEVLPNPVKFESAMVAINQSRKGNLLDYLRSKSQVDVDSLDLHGKSCSTGIRVAADLNSLPHTRTVCRLYDESGMNPHHRSTERSVLIHVHGSAKATLSYSIRSAQRYSGTR